MCGRGSVNEHFHTSTSVEVDGGIGRWRGEGLNRQKTDGEKYSTDCTHIHRERGGGNKGRKKNEGRKEVRGRESEKLGSHGGWGRRGLL